LHDIEVAAVVHFTNTLEEEENKIFLSCKLQKRSVLSNPIKKEHTSFR